MCWYVLFVLILVLCANIVKKLEYPLRMQRLINKPGDRIAFMQPPSDFCLKNRNRYPDRQRAVPPSGKKLQAVTEILTELGGEVFLPVAYFLHATEEEAQHLGLHSPLQTADEPTVVPNPFDTVGTVLDLA